MLVFRWLEYSASRSERPNNVNGGEVSSRPHKRILRPRAASASSARGPLKNGGAHKPGRLSTCGKNGSGTPSEKGRRIQPNATPLTRRAQGEEVRAPFAPPLQLQAHSLRLPRMSMKPCVVTVATHHGQQIASGLNINPAPNFGRPDPPPPPPRPEAAGWSDEGLPSLPPAVPSDGASRRPMCTDALPLESPLWLLTRAAARGATTMPVLCCSFSVRFSFANASS